MLRIGLFAAFGAWKSQLLVVICGLIDFGVKALVCNSYPVGILAIVTILLTTT